MVAYYYATQVAIVKGSPNTLAANVSVLVYDVTDTGYTTPLTVYSDPALTVITNITTDAFGIPLTDFYTNNKPNVLWKSGTLTGMWATSTSRAGANGAPGAPGAPGATGPQGPPGINGAGTNADVAAYVNAAGETRTALDARYPTITTFNADKTTQETRLDGISKTAGTTDLVTNGSFRDGLTGWTNTGAWVAQNNTITSWARTMSGSDGAFSQSIVVPAWWAGKNMRLKAHAMTTSTGTLVTTVTTSTGPTTLNHTLTTSWVERTLDITIPAGQGTSPITLTIGRWSGTVYMTGIRLELL